MAGGAFEEVAMFKGKSGVSGSLNSLVDSPTPSSLFSSSSSSVSYEIEGEVGRDVLAQICYSALSRLLDFPEEKFEVLISSEEGDPKESQNSIAKNIRATLKNAISLKPQPYQKWDRLGDEDIDGSHVNSGIQGLPGYIIMRLIPHIETMVSTEGLFRVPGSKVRIVQLKAELSNSDWTSILNNTNYKPQDFASVLKKLLVDLPKSLLPGNHLEAYIQVAGLESESAKLKSLQLLILLLHPTSRLVFQNLLELLWFVSQHEEENKMSAHSLALVFAPNLIWTPTQLTLSGKTLEDFSSVLLFMINNCYEVFEIPTEVQVPAEQHLRKKSTGDMDSSLFMVNTYCQQMSTDSYHTSGHRQALEEVEKLYSYVQSLPDGPQKAQFLKKYESGKGFPSTPQPTKTSSKLWKMLTPSKSRQRKRVDTSDAETPTPRKPCFRKGSLKLKTYHSLEDSVISSPLVDSNLTFSSKRPRPSLHGTGEAENSKSRVDIGEALDTPSSPRTPQVTEI